MSCDYIALANAGVQTLSPYQAGKPIAELQRELGLENIVKLASNENPLGPSKKVIEAINKATADLTRYPDGYGFDLKLALAKKLSVDPDQVTLGNGSNDILELVARAYIEPGKSAIYSEHAFVVYSLAIQAAGGSAIKTKARDWGHDLSAMVDAIRDDTRVIFIANPNNPTGTVLDEAAIVDFLDKVPANVLVVLDEAYFEYVADDQGTDGMALLKYYPNLIVTRTFSKAYGLAAMRVGYAAASPQITDVLNRVRAPFNVNSLALVAAEAALDDSQHLLDGCRVNQEGMKQLTDGVTALGLSFIPSAGNFLSIEFNGNKNVGDLYQALLREGVIVRPVGLYDMPNHLRVSVGLEEENSVFLSALKKVL